MSSVLHPVEVVFTVKFGENAEFAAKMPAGFAIKLALTMLAADNPGFGFHPGQQAEAGALVQKSEVGTGCCIVTAPQVIIDFQIRRCQSKCLSTAGDKPAATRAAAQIGC